MAATIPAPSGPAVFQLNKNLSLFDGNGALAVSVSAPKDPALFAALRDNKPFPSDGDLVHGSIQLQTAPAEKTIQFLQGKGAVSFSASADAHGELRGASGRSSQDRQR